MSTASTGPAGRLGTLSVFPPDHHRQQRVISHLNYCGCRQVGPS